MEILSISKENIDDKLKIIKLNVLGIKSDENRSLLFSFLLPF